MNAFRQSDSWLRHASGWPQENKKTNAGQTYQPWSRATEPVLCSRATELSRGFQETDPRSSVRFFFLPGFFLSPRMILSSPFSHFLLLFWLSLPPLSRSISTLSLPPSSPSVSLGPSGLSGGVGNIGPCQGSSVGPCWRHKGRITAAASHTKTRTAAPRSLFQCPQPSHPALSQRDIISSGTKEPPAHPVLSNTAIRPTNSVISEDNMHS